MKCYITNRGRVVIVRWYHRLWWRIAGCSVGIHNLEWVESRRPDCQGFDGSWFYLIEEQWFLS